ncbi:hypothetical protein A7E75_12110 [Syntrophotalea acetylenica]|uniref:Glycosyl transferase family 1 domain-containing protein n=1 Tax=Syntrophotalea acetylenica TaxID=29542 RepID=A0A1L3GIC0_SYNAC|nr:hypothetical protein A7E75_12110 [Syntrophotalea acetylenica]APG43745.1 hypothetical protein A6070_06145 [Syntrophotalea acetylenica]
MKYFFTGIFVSCKGGIIKKLCKFQFIEKLAIKRGSANIDPRLVKCTFLPEILYQIFLKLNNKKKVYCFDRVHDFLVSIALLVIKFDILISYEKMSLFSFCVSKWLGKINLLDLCTIHPDKIIEINEKYNGVVIGCTNSRYLYKESKLKKKEYIKANYMISLSEFAKQSYVDAGIASDKIFVVNLGVDTNKFSPKKEKKIDAFEILFVAGIRYLKGIKDLIEVFKELCLENSKLTIVGGCGDAIEYVKQNISENIEYIPYLEHSFLREVYRRASVFALPSYMDSWGQVVVEALSSGLPVIISENTGAKELLSHGENGFIIKVGDRNELKKYILYCYNNKDRLEIMSRNARKSVEKLTWENYYQQIDSIIEHIKREI